MKSLEDLIATLKEKKILKTSFIIKAFLTVDRANFVLPEYVKRSYEDLPLPLKEKQTISQPLTVAFMMELLQPDQHHRILDIGSGSGYTTALLAEIAGPDGQVFAVERIKWLKEFGENNLKKLAYKNVRFREGNGANGWSEHAPFDRILVNAAAPAVPQPLKEQLKTGGRLVIPLDNADGPILLLEKRSPEQYAERRFPGFSFVPFIDDPSII
ncbi:protein-L-isoaspartate(D-aspartate) O-methyltransferase [Candidatus Formimonas warabiya]|uniref:Protein-L-isoaspartate O-methyltransferase n=1 Tax=Formimonas warabiya TaxID=1761012 RepID=A0A3G1KQA5_FORW1|nr:protein-L-isoaspartate(D-aspartate) O-methyltransferase [Candidatus Formimonas warabiya]ATW24315.1 protein-L-isoaspartate O-methyltransferase [Candidatus Formimonas warabiya]